MRKLFAIALLSCTAACMAWGQSNASSAAAAKPVQAAPAKPTAIIETSVGKMTCTLFPDKAPIGVANFIGLSNGTKDWKNPSGATKHGVPLYDGTIFHRVIAEFMIQGGDPAGTGSGPDPVPAFKNEVHSDLLFDKPGRLAYANAGADTNSSQFFITEIAFTGQQGTVLNGHYTIFGQCDDAAVELVKQISHMATDPRTDRPFRPVKIVHITIIRPGHASGTAPRSPVHPAKPAASSNN